MARAKTEEDFVCTVVFTQESEKRITTALVDLYYSRKKGMTKAEDETEQKQNSMLF